MEKTEEIKRYLKFQKKLRALRLGEDLGCKYACEVFKNCILEAEKVCPAE